MKKIRLLAFVIAVVFCASLCGCAKQEGENSGVSREYDETVNKAITALKEAWTQRFDTLEESLGSVDRYVEIKNTRVVRIKDNTDENFRDMECIVEFMTLSNGYNTAPYYMDTGMLRFVVISKDGTATAQQMNPLMTEVREGNFDLSHLIDSVTELDSAYNQVLEF